MENTNNNHSQWPPAGIIVSVALAISCFGFTAFADEENEKSADDLSTVTVIAVQSQQVTARVNVSGSLVAREEVLVYPQINGYEIESIHADIGDSVSAGETLLQLDTKTLEARLTQAEADVTRAEATIGQSKSQIDSARATLVQASSALRRNQTLRKSGNVPESAIEESRASADSAKAGLASAEDGLGVANAQLRQVVAQRDIAILELSRATVKSPVSGLISVRNAKRGAITQSGGEPLFRIISDGEIELQAELIETDLTRIQPGMAAQITIPGVGPRDGAVRLISPALDPQTRLGVVKVSLPHDPNIRVGGFAEGWLTTAKRETLVIPNSAIQFTGAGDTVSVVNDGVIEKRRVQAGVLDGKWREIVSGVDKGELVVVTAGSFFRDGDRVNTVVKTGVEADQ